MTKVAVITWTSKGFTVAAPAPSQTTTAAAKELSPR
jgi:hypothetical protein